MGISYDALDFVERSQTYTELQPLFDDFSNTIARFGFHAFILTGLPSVGDEVEPLVICNRWPEEWTGRYREQRYFMDDPVSRWSLSQTRPFRWKQAWENNLENERTLRIRQEASEFGLVDGIAFPMYDASSWQAVISLATDRKLDVTKKDEATLYLASVYFKMAAEDLRKRADPPKSRLTEREREILRWAALGKTAWETAQILGVEEATVRRHLANVNVKLNVANKTQAIVDAIRRHEIHL